MSQVLRQSTQVVVRVGPFVDVGDGFTPETGVTLSGADEAELLKAAGAATVDISGATWAAITGADGWYNLTLTTSHTDTVGTLDVVVNDDSVCLPVFVRFQVIEEAAFDAIYAASAAPATAAGVSAVETDTQDIQARLPAALVSGRIDASVGAMATDVMTAAAAAADLIVELQSGVAAAVVAEFAVSGSVAGGALAASSSDVDIANLGLDLLVENPITSFTDDTPEARWVARNYALARDGELRDNPWKFGRKRRVLYPLDYALRGISGTISGAWGTVRLSEDWVGDIVEIRRSSDSTSDTFAAADDAVEVDTDAIATFVGDGTGYISSLIDQTGNARPLLQATTTRQPTFDAEAGEEGRPAAVFDGVDDLLATAGALSNLISTAAGYIVIVGLVEEASDLTLDSATVTSDHVLAAEASGNVGLYARKGGMLYATNNDGARDTITEGVPVEVPFVAELRHVDGTLYSRVNGENEQSSASGTTSSLAGVLNIGDLTAGGQALGFSLFAVLTFSSAPTAEERNRLVKRLMRWVGAGGYQPFGWTYRYPLPADCGRVISISANGRFEGRPIPHEIEDGCILTDQPGPLPVLYIEKGIDASRFDPLFSEALAAKMAMKGAHFFTGKTSMLQLATNAYNEAIKKAKKANAFESTAERPYDSEIVDLR